VNRKHCRITLSKHWTYVPRCYTLLLMRKKLTAIRLKPEQLQKLDKIARREDVPISWLIRRAIDEFLKRKK
jgi:Ribbon-helix-helix protein, copG family